MNANELPLNVTYIFVTTANPGTSYTTFADTPCTFLRVRNASAVDIAVKKVAGGDFITIAAGRSENLYGVKNANLLQVRRTDTSNTGVRVEAEVFN